MSRMYEVGLGTQMIEDIYIITHCIKHKINTFQFECFFSITIMTPRIFYCACVVKQHGNMSFITSSNLNIYKK